MRYHSEIDNENSLQNAWFAKQDALVKDATNIKLYSEAEIQAGIELERMVSSAFIRSRVFRQHRERFIVVKVERPQKADRDSYEALTVERFCDKKGYTRHRTAGAILFRIPKKES